MSDFLDVTKYLDKIPVRVATLQEALNANIPFDKFYGKIPTRAIKKLFWFIQLRPIRTVQSIPGRLVYQYNLTMPKAFYILNTLTTEPFVTVAAGVATQCVVAVKWRVGTVVHRYCILNKQFKGPTKYFSGFVPFVSFINTFPDYTNQVIPANCVIEIWSSFMSLIPPDSGARGVGFNYPVTIQTSLMSDPATADDVAVILDSGAPLQITDIGVNLPEALPYNQPTIVWNDN